MAQTDDLKQQAQTIKYAIDCNKHQSTLVTTMDSLPNLLQPMRPSTDTARMNVPLALPLPISDLMPQGS